MSAANSIPALAREASTWLERREGGRKHSDGLSGVIIYRKLDAPAWVTDLCRSAHDDGRMLPDDWRYELIVGALDAIGECDDDADRDTIQERAEEAFDGSYVYTKQLTGWLGSHGYRSGYVDDAAKEWGPADDTLQAIARGMLLEFLEVFQAVYQALEELQAEREDQAEELAEG